MRIHMNDRIFINAAASIGALAVTILTGVRPAVAGTNAVDLGTIVVEGSALSRYRPETVNSGTFTDIPPEKLPCVVDTLTEDFIRERNPTDLNDLLRHVPGCPRHSTGSLRDSATGSGAGYAHQSTFPPVPSSEPTRQENH